MKREPIQLTVYRRNDRMVVVPAALANTGFRSLHDVIDVDAPNDLVQALEAGEKLAEAAAALPKAERFPARTPYWEVLGCDDYDDFVKGTTAVTIVRRDQHTRVGFMVPTSDNTGFIGTKDPELFGPDTSLSEIAKRALQLLDEHRA